MTVNDQMVYSKQKMGGFPDFQAVSRQTRCTTFKCVLVLKSGMLSRV